MNNTEPRPLLKLYKLLWEQIKDKNIIGLLGITKIIYANGIITHSEMLNIDENILIEKDKLGGFVNPKSFVQQQIEKLKNKE